MRSQIVRILYHDVKSFLSFNFFHFKGELNFLLSAVRRSYIYFTLFDVRYFVLNFQQNVLLPIIIKPVNVFSKKSTSNLKDGLMRQFKKLYYIYLILWFTAIVLWWYIPISIFASFKAKIITSVPILGALIFIFTGFGNTINE